MKKRILSILMAVVLMVSALPVMGVSAKKGQVFMDINPDTWYGPYVYPLSEQGIVNGMDDTHFKGRNNLTRAEFLILLGNSVMNKPEFSKYTDLHLCPDADDSNGRPMWYAAYLNWAAQEGIIPAGERFRPREAILRYEAVELTYTVHKAYSSAIPLTPIKEALDFADSADIPESTLEALAACSSAGVISGDTEGRFLPNKTLNRGEGSRMMCSMLGIEPWDKSQIPTPPKFEAPKTGSAYGATYVEFDPQYFTPKVVLAKGKLDTTAPGSSIVSGQNAYIAVNGTTFDDNSSTKDVNGTIVSGGQVVRDLSTPDGQTNKPSFVIDTNGRASIQWMDITQTVKLTKDGKTYKAIENIGHNLRIGDNNSTRMIYTKEFGSTIPGKVRYALEVDKNNKVTKVYKNSTSNVPIPSSGYVLFERKERGWDNDDVFKYAEVGDIIDRQIVYKGSSVQNIQTSISCGPTILKNGAVYGNSSTYAQEGFDSSSNVVGGGTHMLIGVKPDGKVVIACASGSQRQMGQIMKNLGCKDAMNLDGGGSTYLNCNGRQMASPGRQLTNMLIFVKK